MDAAAEVGRDPVSEVPDWAWVWRMSMLTRDGTTEPVSRDQILSCEQGQGNVHFTWSVDHEQDWQPYTVDPYSAESAGHTYITAQQSDLSS